MKVIISLLIWPLFFISQLVLAQSVETYIPPQAFQYLPIVKTEAQRIIPEILTPWYFGGLIEHESCISLKHGELI